MLSCDSGLCLYHAYCTSVTKKVCEIYYITEFLKAHYVAFSGLI